MSTIETLNTSEVKTWIKAAPVADFPEESGTTIKYKDVQIAVFNFSSRNEWYATQNLCPHKFEMALSRGLIGDTKGEPKVSCPFHKKNFSLKSGKCLSGDEDLNILTFPVKIEDDYVFIGLPFS